MLPSIPPATHSQAGRIARADLHPPTALSRQHENAVVIPHEIINAIPTYTHLPAGLPEACTLASASLAQRHVVGGYSPRWSDASPATMLDTAALANHIGDDAVAFISREQPDHQSALVDECFRVVDAALHCCSAPERRTKQAAALLLGCDDALPRLQRVMKNLHGRLTLILLHLPLSALPAPSATSIHHASPVYRVLGCLLRESGLVDTTTCSFDNNSIVQQIEQLKVLARTHPLRAEYNIDSMIATALALSHHVTEQAQAIACSPVAGALRDSLALLHDIERADRPSLVRLMTQPILLRHHINCLVSLTQKGNSALPPILHGIGKAIADAVANALPDQLSRLLTAPHGAMFTATSASVDTMAETLLGSEVIQTLQHWQWNPSLRRLYLAMNDDIPCILAGANASTALDVPHRQLQPEDGRPDLLPDAARRIACARALLDRHEADQARSQNAPPHTARDDMGTDVPLDLRTRRAGTTQDLGQAGTTAEASPHAY